MDKCVYNHGMFLENILPNHLLLKAIDSLRWYYFAKLKIAMTIASTSTWPCSYPSVSCLRALAELVRKSRGECGFFVWDTCVTMGLVQKFLYFTAAISGTIAFQIGAFHFV